MPNTTNYSFPTPADTDLVKNGADAIRDLGDAVDTAMNTALGTKKAMGVLLSTVSFSGVSSVSLPADTFTSTYQTYKILFTLSASSGAQDINFKYRASGSDLTNTYFGGFSGFGHAGAAKTWALNNAASGKVAENDTTSQRLIIVDMVLEAPQLTSSKPTTFNTVGNTAGGGVIFGGAGGFEYNTTGTAADSCSFIASSGNFTGSVSAFGVAK